MSMLLPELITEVQIPRSYWSDPGHTPSPRMEGRVGSTRDSRENQGGVVPPKTK